MSNRIVAVVLVVFLLFGIGAAAFVFPSYANRGIHFINAKTESVSFLPNIPSIPVIPFQLGLDLQGGLRLVYEADLSEVSSAEYESRMRGIQDIIEGRINVFGVREPIIQIQGSGNNQRLIVELPGVTNIDEVNESLKQHPVLEFREVDDENIETEITETEDGTATLQFGDPFQSTGLNGSHLEKASWQLDPIAGPVVTLQFNKEGAQLFKEITERNIGKPVAIYIDGSPIQIATVQDVIPSGNAQISGIESVEEAQRVARNLNAGALPVDITLISSRAVGPILGQASIQDSLFAGMAGFALVGLFLVLVYRFLGVIAAIALVLYALLLLSLFKFFGVTLTLAGIAGFILSIGMAVDANILIFSRMREEIKDGRSLPAAVSEGFRRAWPSIRDGNLTTLLVMLILFLAGSSFVQGFALSLSLGLVLSMVTAMVVTRAFLELVARTKLKTLTILF